MADDIDSFARSLGYEPVSMPVQNQPSGQDQSSEPIESFAKRFYENRDLPNPFSERTSSIEALASGFKSVPSALKEFRGSTEQVLGQYLPHVEGIPLDTQLMEAGKGTKDIARQELQQYTPNAAAGSLPSALYSGAQGLGEFAPALAISALNPAAGMAMMGVQSGIGTTSEQLEGNSHPAVAAGMGIASGIGAAALGELPIKALTEPASNFATRAFQTLVNTEFGAGGMTAIQAAINKGTIDPNMTLDDFEHQMVGTLEAVPVGALGASAAVPAIRKIAYKMGIRPAKGSFTPEMVTPQETASQGAANPTPDLTPGRQWNPQTSQFEDVVPAQSQTQPPAEAATPVAPSHTQSPFYPAEEVHTETRNMRDDALQSVIDNSNDINNPNIDNIQATKSGLDAYQRAQELHDQLETTPQQNVPIYQALGDDVASIHQLLDRIDRGDIGELKGNQIGSLLDNGFVEFKKGNFDLTESGTKLRDYLAKEPVSETTPQLSDKANIESVHDTLDDVWHGNTKNIDGEVAEDLLQSGHIKATEDGNYAITSAGKELLATLKDVVPIPHEEFGTKVEEKVPTEVPKVQEENIGKVPESAISENVSRGTEPTAEMEVPRNVEPSPRFVAYQDRIKDQIQKVAQRINPSVDVRFADTLFGEGEALKESGAATSERQPVAGSYDPMRNLMEISLDTSKFNPLDTAHHELWHSLENMLPQQDKQVLDKAFPGNEKFSPLEHRANEFSNWVKGKETTGIPAAARRAFAKVKNFLSSVGRALHMNGFHSVDDIFGRAHSGETAKQYHLQQAKDALIKGDIPSLNEAIRNGNIEQKDFEKMVRDVSPDLYHNVYNKNTDYNTVSAAADHLIDKYAPPEAKMYSIGTDAFDQNTKVDDRAIDKAMDMAEKTFSPMMTEAGKQDMNKLSNIVKLLGKPPREGQSMRAALAANFEDFARTMLFSAEDHIRWKGDAHNIPTAHTIADSLYSSRGKAGAKKATFAEMRDRLNGNWKNKVVNALEYGAKSAELKGQKFDKNKVAEIMQHPETWHQRDMSSGEGYAAMQLSKVVDEMGISLKKLGVEIGDLNGMFPRVEDLAAIKDDQKGFREARTKVLRLTDEASLRENHAAMETDPNKRTATYDPDVEKYIKNEIDDTINKTIEHLDARELGLKLDTGRFSLTPSAPDVPTSFKQRRLVKERDDIERKYLIQDPVTALFRNINQTSNYSAWNEHFGNGKWETLEKQLRKEGADGDFIDSIKGDVAAATGIMREMQPQAIKNVAAFARLVTSYKALPKALWVHTFMPMMATIMHGNPMHSLQVMSNMKDLWLKSNGDKARMLKDFAETLGILSNVAEHTQIESMLEHNGTIANRLDAMGSQFFRSIGIEPYMKMFTIAQASVSKFKVEKLAQDIIKHGDSYSNNYKSSQYYMDELGIALDEVKPFSQWVVDRMDNPGAPVAPNDPMMQKFQEAVLRDTRMVAMTRDRAAMPKYADHPLLGFGYGIQTYLRMLEKNVLTRSYHLADEGAFGLGTAAEKVLRGTGNVLKGDLSTAKQRFGESAQAIKGNVEKGYSGGDRWRFISHVIFLPLMYFFSAGYRQLRKEIGWDKKDENIWERSIEGSHMFGPLSGVIDWAYNKYEQGKHPSQKKQRERPFFSGALGGPTLDIANQYSSFLRNLGSLSPHGETKDRKGELARLYSMVVAPAATATLSTFNPFPVSSPPGLAVLGAITAINTPQAQAKFAKETEKLYHLNRK